MIKLNWEAIGVISALIFGIIQVFKKDKPSCDKKVNQSIKGLFISKNDITQKIEDKE